MDLSFGQEYDDFRGEVVNFLANNTDKTEVERGRQRGLANFSLKTVYLPNHSEEEFVLATLTGSSSKPASSPKSSQKVRVNT